jgi:hypothetical protein
VNPILVQAIADYPLEYFIAKFEAVAEEDWTSARRLCGATELARLTPEDQALDVHTWFTVTAESAPKGVYLCLSDVESADHKKFKQPTARERVLAALNWIKENRIDG